MRNVYKILILKLKVIEGRIILKWLFGILGVNLETLFN